MSNGIVQKEQSTEVVSLSKKEAQKHLDNSLKVIEKLRPEKPEWLWENHENGMTPLKDMPNRDLVVICIGGTLAVSALGALAGIIVLVGGGALLDMLLPVALPVLGAKASALIGAGATGSLVLSYLVTDELALRYGGSKAKQPIRKKMAEMFYNDKLAELEYRVQEYESYQKALKAHQIVIERERQKLEEKQVFQALETGRVTKSIDDNGKLTTVDKPLSEMKFDDPYENVSLQLLEYLEEEKKAITGMSK